MVRTHPPYLETAYFHTSGTLDVASGRLESAVKAFRFTDPSWSMLKQELEFFYKHQAARDPFRNS